jgi:hypothetical protein
MREIKKWQIAFVLFLYGIGIGYIIGILSERMP